MLTALTCTQMLWQAIPLWPHNCRGTNLHRIKVLCVSRAPCLPLMICAQKDDSLLVEATATKHSGYAYTVPVRLSRVLPTPSLETMLDNLVQ